MFQTKTQIVILNDILTFKQANKQKTEREKIKGKNNSKIRGKKQKGQNRSKDAKADSIN